MELLYFDQVNQTVDLTAFYKWRIFNGTYWTMYLDSKQEALSLAVKLGGNAVGQLTAYGMINVCSLDEVA